MESNASPAPLHPVVGPFQDDGLLSPDYTCRDYDLLERRFKMTGWDSCQQGTYEAGWEAAIRFYWESFQRSTKVEYIESVIEERDNIARIMADAADANVKSAAHERVEHAKTTAVLRQILAESGSYLQTRTREAAMERIACTGNCVCLPNPSDQRADQEVQHGK